MRAIDDKVSYIKELQHFLSTVLENSGITFENGIYDAVTRAAVVRFKTQNGLTPDTVVDLETYSLLYEKYLSAATVRSRELKRGDRGDDVLALNVRLRAVGADYTDVPLPEATSYFSGITEASVITMREIFGLKTASYADSLFLQRLDLEYKLTGKNNGSMR